MRKISTGFAGEEGGGQPPSVGAGLPGVPVAYPDAQHSAFAVKYITLAVVAAVLAFALGELNGWQLMVSVLVYGLFLIAGWVLLSVIDSRQFLPMLAIGATFLLQRRYLRAQEGLALARIEAEQAAAFYRQDTHLAAVRAELDARRVVGAELAQASRSPAQSYANRVSTYVAPVPEPVAVGQPTPWDGWEDESPPQEDAPRLVVDELKARMLNFLADAYMGGKIDAHGRITCGVPWGKRGGMTDTERQRVLELFVLAANANGGAVIWEDKERRGWYVDVKRYKSAGRLVAVFQGIVTARG